MKTILKQASANATTNRKMVQQAQVEKRILRRMKHPFIIELNCAFQTRDKLLLVLEICPGGDLKSHVSRCGRFPPEVAAFCAAQARAASLCHQPRPLPRPQCFCCCRARARSRRSRSVGPFGLGAIPKPSFEISFEPHVSTSAASQLVTPA